MEHLLFHLVVETIQALDRRLQRPLSRVIPDHAILRADPRAYLSRTTVQVGPKKRHALAAVLALMSAIVVTALLIFAMEQFPRPKKPDFNRIAGVIATFVAVLLVVRHYCMKWLTGGTMTLQPAGVELTHRELTLFLPWELFRVSGSLFEPDPRVAVVPIDPTVPVAVSGADGEITALLPDALDLPQAATSEFAQLALKDQYEVRVGELAALILELGERLGEGGPMRSFRSIAAPLAMPDADGTLRIQLTQLPFPPFCAGCGAATPEVLEAPVAHKKLRHKIEIPFCEACAKRRRTRRTNGAVVGTVIGILAGIVLAVMLVPPGQNLDLFVLFTVIFSVMFVIPAAAIGLLVGRDAGAPFALRDYQPDKGTVKLYLRDPQRSAGLLEAMGLAVAAAPVNADEN